LRNKEEETAEEGGGRLKSITAGGKRTEQNNIMYQLTLLYHTL